jgi:hypothetical protein
MKFVKDYLRMAEEAHKLARSAPPEQRAQIKKIADAWEEMAQQREQRVERQPGQERRKTKR